MIYVTGDLHRENDIDKLYKIAKLEKIPDIVLIAGDFGGIWDPVQNTENGVEPGELDKRFLKQLSEFPFKIITCLGNHENYDAISMLPRTETYGGKIIKLTDNVEILDRGYVFTIEGKKIFSLGVQCHLISNTEQSISHGGHRKLSQRQSTKERLLN